MSKYKRRADGRYCKQIFVGYTPDGKRKMKIFTERRLRRLSRKKESSEIILKTALI